MHRRVLDDKRQRDFVRRLLIGVVILFSCHGCDRPRAGAQIRHHSSEFGAARALVVNGEYQRAIASLTDFARQHPNSKHASRAGLFLFKANLALGNIPAARQWCEWTIERFPQSLEAHKCAYKLAMISMLEGEDEDALRQFGVLANRPCGPLAAEATAMVRFLGTPRSE